MNRYRTAQCECLACGHGWVAVMPEGAPDGALECPKCGLCEGEIMTVNTLRERALGGDVKAQAILLSWGLGWDEE